MVKSCAALGCTYDWSSSKTDDANISFHKFPLRHPDLLDVWTTRIGRSAFIPTEHSRLCSRHFQRTDFNNPDAPKHRRLRDDAIPSLNLPNFPVGDGVGGSMSEDPRLHATMAPQERNNYPNPMPAMAQAVPSAPAHLCNAAHAHAHAHAHPHPHPHQHQHQHQHPHPHQNNDNGQRDSLDWLNNNSHHTFSDADNVLEESNEMGWPPNLQQQQQQQQAQQQQAQQQQQQQPVPAVNEQPSQVMEKQLDINHPAVQSRSSPNILSTDSGSEEEEEQPPAKKPCFGNLQIDCDIDAVDMQPAGMRQEPPSNTNSFSCPSHGAKQPLMAAAALARGPALEPRALLHSKMGKKRKGPGGKPLIPEEKAAAPTSSWDSLWSNVGHAVRVVAEAVAFFLLTKADISREQHQMQMEQCRRNIQQASCSCNATSNYREWEAGSDVNSTQDSESEQGEVENMLDQNNCLKSEPDDTPKE